MLFMHQMPLDGFFQKVESIVCITQQNIEKSTKIQRLPDDEHNATLQLDSDVPDGLAATAER